MPEPPTTQFKRSVDTRRSQRVVVRVRIIVRRQTDGDGLMSEATHSLVVSAHGALIALAMSVQAGEKLVVKNWNSAEEQECRVVRLSEEGKNEVAIEFAKPVPHFWHIDFPPADWKALPD
jgi:hypothetical protein